MKPIIIRIDPDNPSEEELLRAARVARDGGLVVYPTDTVYGLGTNPLIPSAVLRVYQAKRRPMDKPLPVLVSSIEAAKRLVEMSPIAECLARSLWPGAVTLALPVKPIVPRELHAGTGKLGVRMPNHWVALRLIEMSGGALVGTSANRHGRKSPRTAREAVEQLDGEVDVVIDAGPAPGGKPSTVIELQGDEVRLIREGPISLDTITKLLGECRQKGGRTRLKYAEQAGIEYG